MQYLIYKKIFFTCRNEGADRNMRTYQVEVESTKTYLWISYFIEHRFLNSKYYFGLLIEHQFRNQ